MNKLSFTFDKPYDEVEIHGETFKLYFDDESLRKYQKQAVAYQQEVKEFLDRQAKIPEMSEEEIKELEEQGLKFIRDFVEEFYGEGSFEKFYEQSGKAMINFMPLVEFTLEWLQNKTPDTDRKREYYVGKKK